MEKETLFTREDILTSTGKKFLRHKEKIDNYISGKPATIISAHISPEGACNLNCSYCSVCKRTTSQRIGIINLVNYMDVLEEFGCKAVIFTGGGEPTLYPDFDKMVMEAMARNFEIALITNGTLIKKKKIKDYPFSWLRISVNADKKWIDSILDLTKEDFHPSTRVGLSYIHGEENLAFSPEDLLYFARMLGAEYIRLLPDCTGDNFDIAFRYKKLYEWLGKNPDPLFMVQHKTHGAPATVVCHQAYFRPYLSELKGGTIFPCDSIPLNTSSGKFDMKYSIGSIGELRDFLKHKIRMNFSPSSQCKGCVFTRNVNLLQDINKGVPVNWITDKIIDENFV